MLRYGFFLLFVVVFGNYNIVGTEKGKIMLPQQLTLLLYDAKIHDDTSELLSLSTARTLHLRSSANKTQQIREKYSTDEQQIKNEISQINEERKELIQNGKSDSDRSKELLLEYEELKTEQNELKDEEEKVLQATETESKNVENELDARKTEVETDRQATLEDRNAIKENLDQDVEQTFGYFK